MATQEASGSCRVCGDSLVRRKGTNHVLHLILSVLTGGLWIIMWILLSIKIGGWKCTKCGKSASRKVFG